ncbi:MAG: winged helix-turn-helix domain-containing protein [Nitrososphaerales archaeon]
MQVGMYAVQSPLSKKKGKFSFFSENDTSLVEVDDHLQLDRRSRIETAFDVLCVIGNGTEKPTRIMYRANLSWTIMHLYVDSLTKKGLILAEETGGKRRYRLSDKGRQIMQQYLSIKQDLDLISEKQAKMI